MSAAERQPELGRRVNEDSLALAREWRRLGRAATFVAVLTSPFLFVALHERPERERALVDALTRDNFFQSSFQQAQNGSAYLVLDRVPTG